MIKPSLIISLLAFLTLACQALAEDPGGQAVSGLTANFLTGSIHSSAREKDTLIPLSIGFYSTLPELGGSEELQSPILNLIIGQLYGAVQVPERALVFIHFPADGQQPASDLPPFRPDNNPGPPFTYHFVTFTLTDGQANLLKQGKAEIIVVTESDGTVYEGSLLPLDRDHDGIPDFEDQCPDTPADAPVNSDGCSIDQLCPCDATWKSHGQYLSHFTKVLLQFRREQIITHKEAISIWRRAVESNCGK
jgi:hypothetical protein